MGERPEAKAVCIRCQSPTDWLTDNPGPRSKKRRDTGDSNNLENGVLGYGFHLIGGVLFN